MSQEPTAFELCLPGIVAGLMLATGEAVFPHAFQEMLPQQAFEVLPVALASLAVLG